MAEYWVKMMRDIQTCSTIVKIVDDQGRWVEVDVTDESLQGCVDFKGYMIDVFNDLCTEWLRLHGNKVRAIPPYGTEARAWEVVDDNIIDGEVVDERRAIEAYHEQ